MLNAHGLDDPLGGFVWVLVLPYMDGLPAGRRKCSVGLSIALDVPRELGLPVLPVCCGHVGVLGTAVPEAAIDEYGDAGAREGDVDPNRLPTRDPNWIVASVPRSCAVQRRANS
jgi:hypothetical protein